MKPVLCVIFGITFSTAYSPKQVHRSPFDRLNSYHPLLRNFQPPPPQISHNYFSYPRFNYFQQLKPPPLFSSEPNYYNLREHILQTTTVPAYLNEFTTILPNPVDYKSEKIKEYLREPIKNDLDLENSRHINQQSSKISNRLPVATLVQTSSEEDNIEKNDKEKAEVKPTEESPATKDKSKLKLKERKDRIDFQVYGFDGPKSYKFGYDTGKGENRQFRFEQRDRDGNVVGQYGYVDDTGKLNVVKYRSDADDGFRTEESK